MSRHKTDLVPLAEVMPRPKKPMVVLFNTTHQTLLPHAVDGVSTVWIVPKGTIELLESEISSDMRSHMAAGRLMKLDNNGA